MKQLLSIIFFLCIGVVCANAQNEPIEFDENGGFSKVVEVKATAKQAFQYSRAYLSKRIKDYNKAVQVEDAEANKIQVNDQIFFKEDALPLESNKPDTKYFFFGNEFYKMTIDCKDNKIRIKVENPTYNYNPYLDDNKLSPYTNTQYNLILRLISDKKHFLNMRSYRFNTIINELVKYIEDQVKEEDF